MLTRLTLSVSLAALALALSGCSGSSAPAVSPAPAPQSFGPLTTRIVGAAQPAVTSSGTRGANVTGIAGALISDLTLNFEGPKSLKETRIAFASNRDGLSQIYTMNADGTNQANLTIDAEKNYSPAWSPDKTKLRTAAKWLSVSSRSPRST